MKLLHVCPSSLTKAPIRFPREPWLAKMMFVGLDLVPWVEILIRKKDGTQKRIVYLFAHCFVQQSRVFEPSSMTFFGEWILIHIMEHLSSPQRCRIASMTSIITSSIHDVLHDVISF